MEPYRAKYLALLVAVSFCCLAASARVNGQGKQAIVILRSAGADAGSSTGCEGGAELSYQIVYDAKLNAKDEIRLLNPGDASPSSQVSRESYDRSGKSKMRDLFALKWGRKGVLYAESIAGQAQIIAVPDNMKPQKNVGSQPLSAFYGVMLSGEARDGKQKRKVDIALRSIWKVYFLAEGASVNDTLFNHATEEASVALWEAYLQKTNNYRASEANAKMRDALITCSRADLANFVQGNYGALDKARQKATRAQSVKDDDATRSLAADLSREQQLVEDARSKAERLIKSEKWDEAIDATEPIQKYLDTWPDLNQMFHHALEQSHEIHLNGGDKSFLANQLEASLTDCSLAWKRLPNSERARACVCRARNEIALRDSKKERQIKRPKEAKELLEKQLADSDCKQDLRLTVELKTSKCEYAQQLYTEARQLLGAGGVAPRPPRPGRRGVAGPAAPANNSVNVKLITMSSKKDFRDARAKLLLAAEMCPDDGTQALLEATNRRLADFCVAEAKSALQRNNHGMAYVYLQSAQVYKPEDASIASLLNEAREHFQQRTHVSIGSAFESGVRTETAGILLSEVTEAIRSAASEAGLSQPGILDDDQSAAAYRSIQAGHPLNSPTVIFTGTVLAANVDVSANPHNVSSSYSYENERWKEADRVHDARNEQYKDCKKQYGEPACGQLKSQVDSLRAYRDQFPRNITERYYYRENPIQMVGAARMSLRSSDSIVRSAAGAETLQAADQWQCIERSGVNPQDYSARDSSCPEPDRRAFFGGIAGKIKNDAHRMALAQLRDLPLSYYKRAQTSTNRQQSVEDYLRFVFLTGNKTGSEAQQAKAFVVAYDPELNTDGVLR
jgi:hypothetical protein